MRKTISLKLAFNMFLSGKRSIKHISTKFDMKFRLLLGFKPFNRFTLGLEYLQLQEILKISKIFCIDLNIYIRGKALLIHG